MLKSVSTLLLLVLAIYLAIHLYVYVNQRNLMYFPTTDRVSPEQVGLLNVEEVVLGSRDGTQLISWFGRARPGQPTILFFHGNGGAVSHRAHRFSQFMQDGYGIFMLGYPGYGGNAGEPSELSFGNASLMAYQYLLSAGVQADDIVIYGESIGSGVAVPLAANVEAKGLILEAPFSSALDAARHHYPFFLVGLLLKDSYESVDHIAAIGMPLLVIHGSDDRIIPIELGRKLYERARQPKTFVELEGAGHNDLQLLSVDQIAREFVEAI